MPALFILVPLAGIFLQNILSRRHGEKTAPWVAGVVFLAYIGMALTNGAALWQGAEPALTKLPFGASLTIDFMSSVVLFTIGLVALMAVAAAGREDRLNFSNLVLVSAMGMAGVAMVRDIFSLYIFLEITAVSSFIMISMRKERDGYEGAFKYLVLSAVATVMMLIAIALVFMTTKNLDFTAVRDFMTNSSPASWPLAMKAAVILLVAGFSIKAGVVPFHGWVPGAYSSAPPAVSVLLAGIVTKAGGVYAILRMMSDVFKGASLGLPFMVLGAVSIVVGVLAAIGQKDMKKMLAWSSVSQVGYIVLGAGLGTPLAIAGALLHFFNHATFKSLLFVNAAAVEEQAGTRDMDSLGGLANNMKITGGTSVVGFLSTAGVPPLSGFWSKLIIIAALWMAGQHFYAVVALLASLITLGYFLILQRKVFFGKLREGLEHVKEGSAKHTVPALVLSAVIVAVGILFPLAVGWMQQLGWLASLGLVP